MLLFGFHSVTARLRQAPESIKTLYRDRERSDARILSMSFETLLASLSPREQEVLQGVVAGKLNKVIAHELGISPRTVEIYRANMMMKTRASSLSELVRMALLAGI